MALMSHAEWMKKTTVFAKPRSAALKAVDEALERCEKFGGGDAMWRLGQALDAWKATCGPGDAWKQSVRNKKTLAVEQLTASLKGGDSEAAWGRVPNYMHSTFDHARLGVLYLLGNLRVRTDVFNVVLEGGMAITGSVLCYQGGKLDDGGLAKASVDTAQNFYNTAIVPVSAILSQAMTAGVDTTLIDQPEKRTLLERARALFGDFVRKTVKLLGEKFGSIEVTAAAAKNLVNLCCKLFLSTVGAGLVSGGLDTFKGLVKVADAAFERIRMYVRSRHVVISSGHPKTVVEAIRQAMNLSVLDGLWQTLKGAGNVGLAFATWGVAMIVGVVTALFEMVVKVVWRLYECYAMQRVCREAATAWKARDSADALHKRPFAFHQWYRGAVLGRVSLPALAVLTLNSGICGDKMVYLSMFHADNSVITTDEFQRGVAFLDGLKPWGTAFLGKSGFAFHSADPMVSKLIEFASGHKANLSLGGKVWEKIVQVGSA